MQLCLQIFICLVSASQFVFEQPGEVWVEMHWKFVYELAGRFSTLEILPIVKGNINKAVVQQWLSLPFIHRECAIQYVLCMSSYKC